MACIHSPFSAASRASTSKLVAYRADQPQKRSDVGMKRSDGTHSSRSHFIPFQANQKPDLSPLSFLAGSHSCISRFCVGFSMGREEGNWLSMLIRPNPANLMKRTLSQPVTFSSPNQISCPDNHHKAGLLGHQQKHPYCRAMSRRFPSNPNVLFLSLLRIPISFFAPARWVSKFETPVSQK